MALKSVLRKPVTCNILLTKSTLRQYLSVKMNSVYFFVLILCFLTTFSNFVSRVESFPISADNRDLLLEADYRVCRKEYIYIFKYLIVLNMNISGIFFLPTVKL